MVAVGTWEWGKGGCFLFLSRSEAFQVCFPGGPMGVRSRVARLGSCGGHCRSPVPALSGSRGSRPCGTAPPGWHSKRPGGTVPCPKPTLHPLTTATAAPTHCEQRFSLRKLYPDPLSGTCRGAGAKACSDDAWWGNACVRPLVQDHSERTPMWMRGEHTGRTLGCIRYLHMGGRDRNQGRGRHWDPLVSSPFCLWVSVTFTGVLSKVRNRHGSPWAQARTRVLERLCYPSHGTKIKSLDGGLSWALCGSHARPGSASCSRGWRVL